MLPTIYTIDENQCPACGRYHWAGAQYMGGLGSLSHFRCPDCGAQWSQACEVRAAYEPEDGEGHD